MIVPVSGLSPRARILATLSGSGNLEMKAVLIMTRLAYSGVAPFTSKYNFGSLANGLHEYNLPAAHTMLHRVFQSLKCSLRANFTALLLGFSRLIAMIGLCNLRVRLDMSIRLNPAKDIPDRSTRS